MNKRLQIEHLARLLHLEVHLVSTYDGATARLGETGPRDQLDRLREDHERHVLDITELIREMGEPTPPDSPDVEGLVAPAISAMRNADGVDDVLHAIRMAERIVGHAYAEARNWGVGMQVHELLGRCDADEQRHLAVLGDLLAASRH